MKIQVRLAITYEIVPFCDTDFLFWNLGLTLAKKNIKDFVKVESKPIIPSPTIAAKKKISKVNLFRNGRKWD